MEEIVFDLPTISLACSICDQRNHKMYNFAVQFLNFRTGVHNSLLVHIFTLWYKSKGTKCWKKEQEQYYISHGSDLIQCVQNVKSFQNQLYLEKSVKFVIFLKKTSCYSKNKNFKLRRFLRSDIECVCFVFGRSCLYSAFLHFKFKFVYTKYQDLIIQKIIYIVC